MPKEDYLLKYLEKLGRVVAAMMGFREKGFPDESLRIADEALKELLNIDFEELTVMPVEKFISIIKNEKYNSSYLEGIAQLTYETAKTLTTLGKKENADSFYSKSLQLYYLQNEKDKTFSFEREMKISELLQLTNKNK
ncbi:MAG: hypothetical protein WCG93_04425 [Paludibacter sp.]